MTWVPVSVDHKILGIWDYTTVHMANQRVEIAILATQIWEKNYKPQNSVRQTY